ncbi:MAG: hypothetical protein V4714_09690 [Bacteroidota bacterium]
MDSIETKNRFGKTFCITEYDSANDWIYANWFGFVTPDDIKKWSVDYLKLLNQTNCSRFLINNKELRGPWQQANEWIAVELTPKAIAGGLRYYAHVVSPDLFGAMSVNDLEKRVEGVGFVMRVFKEMDAAQDWLSTCT